MSVIEKERERKRESLWDRVTVHVWNRKNSRTKQKQKETKEREKRIQKKIYPVLVASSFSTKLTDMQ